MRQKFMLETDRNTSQLIKYQSFYSYLLCLPFMECLRSGTITHTHDVESSECPKEVDINMSWYVSNFITHSPPSSLKLFCFLSLANHATLSPLMYISWEPSCTPSFSSLYIMCHLSRNMDSTYSILSCFIHPLCFDYNNFSCN